MIKLIYSKFGIKIFMLVSLLYVFFVSNFSFATDTTWIPHLFLSIIDLLSLIWYIFPILAWKLMTNTFVYGTFLWIDKILWDIWNISKNFANFLIWFIFIYFIFRYLVKFWEKDWALIKTNLPKLAVSVIIVNMSWFIMWLLIDISNILIAWIGILPLNFINNTDYKFNITKEINIIHASCQKEDASWEPSSKANKICVAGSEIIHKNNMTVSLKDFQSYENSISWPLLFLWYSILEITKLKKWFLDTSVDVWKQKLSNQWAKVKLFMKAMIFLLLLVPMIVLIVVNIVRIFWIRIYIWFSPLIFLDQIFWNKVMWKKQKAFVLKNMIWLIFQPVVVVWAFSICIIFLSWIGQILIWWNTKYKDNFDKAFNLKTANQVVDSTFFQIQDTWWIFTSFLWWFFGYVLFVLLTTFVLWWMIKLSFKASEVTSSVSSWMFKFTEWLMKSIPFVPTGSWKVSIGSLWILYWRMQALPTSISESQRMKLEEKFGFKHDVKSNKKESILIDLEYDKTIWKWINEAINVLEWYKNEDITKFNNAKQILDRIVKIIKNEYNPKLKDIKINLKIYKDDPNKQLEEILSNQDIIKKIFK